MSAGCLLAWAFLWRDISLLALAYILGFATVSDLIFYRLNSYAKNIGEKVLVGEITGGWVRDLKVASIVIAMLFLWFGVLFFGLCIILWLGQ